MGLIKEFLNPFIPGNFGEKCILKLVKWFSGPLSCHKELKLTIKPFTGHTLCRFLIQLQNISLQSLGMCRKQNLEILGLKVTQQS